MKYFDEEEPAEIVGVEAEDEHEAFRHFLWAILENYGPSDGKYSPKRIRINILPGRDYEGPLDDSYLNDLKDLREELDSHINQKRDPNWK